MERLYWRNNSEWRIANGKWNSMANSEW